MKTSNEIVIPALTPEALDMARKATNLAWAAHDTGCEKEEVLRALMACVLTVSGFWMKPQDVITWLRELSLELGADERAAQLRRELRDEFDQ